MERKTWGKSVSYASWFGEFWGKFEAEAKRRALLCANAVRTAAVRGMADPPKTGRIYRVPGTKRAYQASSPGEFPAIRTGVLRASIKTMVYAAMTVTGGVIEGVVGTNLAYGLYLETGTVRVARRPWLTMALVKAQPAIEKILGDQWLL